VSAGASPPGEATGEDLEQWPPEEQIRLDRLGCADSCSACQLAVREPDGPRSLDHPWPFARSAMQVLREEAEQLIAQYVVVLARRRLDIGQPALVRYRGLRKMAIPRSELGDDALGDSGERRCLLLAQRRDLGRAESAVPARGAVGMQLATRGPLAQRRGVDAEQLASRPDGEPFWGRRRRNCHFFYRQPESEEIYRILVNWFQPVAFLSKEVREALNE